MNIQSTLNDLKTQLTEDDIDALVLIFGAKCALKTKSRLRSILKYHPSSIGSHGIYNRVMKTEHGWSYCAGQSYPDEIRCVRECILGRG